MNGPTPNVWEANRTMIIGSTGFIGRFLTVASLESGRSTYIFVRSGTVSPSKASTLKTLQEKGATIIYGSVGDQQLMEKVIKEHKIEVVISAVGADGITEQINLVKAIKAVGAVKRFLPSEFGHDIDRADPVEPGLSMYNEKRRVRRFIEEAGIPYTYICCNSIAAWPYYDNTHPSEVLPPLDYFQIYGDGTVKAYFVSGTDIGRFTMKALDDDRTLNKTLHFRPPNNLLNMNGLASLWEEKIGRKLPRVTITEDDLLDAARGVSLFVLTCYDLEVLFHVFTAMRIPQSIVAAITHDIFIKGCQTNYSLDKPTDVDVSSLYPNTPFRDLGDCFNDFVAKTADNPKTVSKAAATAAANNDIMGPNSKREPMIITA